MGSATQVRTGRRSMPARRDARPTAASSDGTDWRWTPLEMSSSAVAIAAPASPIQKTTGCGELESIARASGCVVEASVVAADDQRHLLSGESLQRGNRPLGVARERVVDVADAVDVARSARASTGALSPWRARVRAVSGSGSSPVSQEGGGDGSASVDEVVLPQQPKLRRGPRGPRSDTTTLAPSRRTGPLLP